MLPLLGQTGALGHAEAVLLVHDDQPQGPEFRGVGQQGVGAHGQQGLSTLQGLQCLPALGGLHGAGQQGYADAQGLEQGPQGRGVLLRQNFRGGHHGALQAVFRGEIDRRRGHHGLAAAHVALDEPGHGHGLCEIRAHVVDGPLLGAGQLEGQGGTEGVQVQRPHGLPAVLGGAGPEHGKADGEDEELLKHQPVSGDVQGREVRRVVDGVVGGLGVAQAVLRPQRRGQHLRQGPAAGVQGLEHRLGDQLVGHAGGQAVDRHDPPCGDAGVLRLLHHGVGHLVAQVVAGEGAVEDIGLAVDQIVLHITLVEEHQIQGRGLVGHPHLHQIQALADARQPGMGDDHGLETGRGVRLQLRDGDHAAAVLVGPGEIGDEVVQGVDAEVVELLRPGLADALEIAHGIEKLRHGVHPLHLVCSDLSYPNRRWKSR